MTSNILIAILLAILSEFSYGSVRFHNFNHKPASPGSSGKEKAYGVPFIHQGITPERIVTGCTGYALDNGDLANVKFYVIDTTGEKKFTGPRRYVEVLLEGPSPVLFQRKVVKFEKLCFPPPCKVGNLCRSDQLIGENSPWTGKNTVGHIEIKDSTSANANSQSSASATAVAVGGACNCSGTSSASSSSNSTSTSSGDGSTTTSTTTTSTTTPTTTTETTTTPTTTTETTTTPTTTTETTTKPTTTTHSTTTSTTTTTEDTGAGQSGGGGHGGGGGGGSNPSG